MIPDIRIEDYNYDLPESRIAKYPLPQRDASKLLCYSAEGECTEKVFRDLPSLLPKGALMIFNDTKVVPARLFFRRESGAHIEVFCLEPHAPAEYATAFAATGTCSWKCVIGNAKRWKDDTIYYDAPAGMNPMNLRARLLDRDGQTGTVEFSWDGGEPFSAILDHCGRVPIPPYLNRETEAIDLERYQTLYAHIRGSVAAPTAGLHFTDAVLEAIDARGIDRENVCLHVGAGTFLPVKTSHVSDHPMHREPFVVTRSLLEKLLVFAEGASVFAEGSSFMTPPGLPAAPSRGAAGASAFCDEAEVLEGELTRSEVATSRGKQPTGLPVIAVGTTSVRTLESLYYAGVHCIEEGRPSDIGQWEPYTREYSYSTAEALEAIIAYLDREGLEELKLGTRIIIVPGFKFRIVDMIVTNFHQPQSTLLLLISAFVGGDWKTIYDFALGSGFRFLSYGDSSLLHRR